MSEIINNIDPLGPRVLVKLEPIAEKRTAGGIIIPDQHAEQSRIGEILATGEDVKKLYTGDTVLVAAHTGVLINLPGSSIVDDTLRIFNESEILIRIMK